MHTLQTHERGLSLFFLLLLDLRITDWVFEGGWIKADWSFITRGSWYVFSCVESNFQMTVKRNNAIAIDVLGDWLKNLAPVFFHPMRSETKTSRTLYGRFFPRLEQVTSNCWEFWVIHALFARVLIAWGNYFGSGLLTFIWKTLYSSFSLYCRRPRSLISNLVGDEIRRSFPSSPVSLSFSLFRGLRETWSEYRRLQN